MHFSINTLNNKHTIGWHYASQWVFTTVLLLLGVLLTTNLAAQVNTGGPARTSDHGKEVIGYITNWDAWKNSRAGVPGAGALTQLNIDYSKYTILNYSFFGVAVDGSLHSGDLRNKNINQPGTVQQPGDIFLTDVYSGWDMHILFGEIEPLQYISAEGVQRATAQGFVVEEGGTSWDHPHLGAFPEACRCPFIKRMALRAS